MKKLILIFAALCLAIPALAYDDVTPTEAYVLATSAPNIYILDVRTSSEWIWVGHPGVNKLNSGVELEEKVVNVSVMISLMNELVDNPFFIKSVEQRFPDKENVTLITMCRSGGRSVTAAKALEAAGFQNVMNMLTGFEGSKDINGYRTLNGWKVDGLPYNYSSEGAYSFDFHGKGNGFGHYK
jgi:rhodanese-related sulfurtransferase